MSEITVLTEQINEFGELLIRMKAMEAANEERRRNGYADAYGEEEYLALQEELGFHHNARIKGIREWF